MSPKLKKDYAKATKKVKRMINGFIQRSGRTPTGIVPRIGPELPDERNPVIVRALTRSELAAIPRDRYEVRVISVRIPTLDTGEVGGEEELVVAITNTEQLARQLKKVRQNLRKRLRDNNGGGGPPSSENPFKDPINQYLMADCVIQVMEDFFHGEDKCTICDQKYNNMEFCVMMHIFFKKIHFLKKETRLQFSKFLQNKVFAGKSGFIRTFNTYADKDIYSDFEDQLDIEQYNFKKRPASIPPEMKPSDYHQRMMLDMSLAFQEIGWAFQKSPYFKELKELKKTVNEFVLQ